MTRLMAKPKSVLIMDADNRPDGHWSDWCNVEVSCWGFPKCERTQVQQEEILCLGGCPWCQKVYLDPEDSRVLFIEQPGDA